MKSLKTLAILALLCVQSLAGTITGQIQTATSGNVANGTLTFQLSQPGVLSGTSTLVTSAVSCYTSTTGNIVGIPDPLSTPVVTQNILSGTLASAIYYIKLTYTGAGGESVPSPETTFSLTANGTLVINAPIIQPASATGYKVYIGTSSGAETLQGTVVGWTQFSQSTPLSAGSALPGSNSSACSVVFSDQIVPTGTFYTVNFTNKNGSQISGFPQTWCTYGGAAGTINVSNGAPTGNCGTNGVFYPTPIMAAPQNGASQSILGPVFFSDFDNIVFIDGTTFTCNSSGWNAAIASLPGSGGTVDATGCVHGVNLSSTVVVGTAVTPVRLKLPSGSVTCTMATGSCIKVQGSGSEIDGPGSIALITGCTSSSLTDFIHVEPVSSANSMNAIRVHGMRIDGSNCPNAVQLNVLSVRDPSYFYDLDLRFWTGVVMNIGLSGNSGALLTQGITVHDVYEQSGSGALTANSNILTGNNIRWLNNKTIASNSSSVGGNLGLLGLYTLNGGGNGIVIERSSFAGYTNAGSTGAAVEFTNAIGAGVGIQNCVVKDSEFESNDLNILVTGADSQVAQRCWIESNYTHGSPTAGLHYVKLDNASLSTIMESPTSQVSGEITLTANSFNNTVWGRVGVSGTDIVNSGSNNNIQQCYILSSMGTCEYSYNVAFDGSNFTALSIGSNIATWTVGNNQFDNASLTLTGATTSLHVAGLWNGGSYVLKVIQDGTGGRALTLGSGCTWKVSGGGGGAVSPTAAANAVDVLAFTYDGTNCYATYTKNFN